MASRSPFLAVALAAVAGFCVGAASLACDPSPPLPAVHDEHSYLLAADTFASGRLANPTHPHWRHFETFQVLQRPTYASKYPPGQGLLLAAGQILWHPILGVWLGMAAMCGAVTWMLVAFFRPPWALLGGLLMAIRLGLDSYWSQAYWGGALAACGAALTFGALPRLLRGAPGAAPSLAAGLSILAITRPLEGLVFALACGIFLLRTATVETGISRRDLCRRVLVGTFPWLALMFLALGIYHDAVTGHPSRMPYRVHSEAYGLPPQFLWQDPGDRPELRQPRLQRYADAVHDRFERRQETTLVAAKNLRRWERIWLFFIAHSLLPPLLLAPLARPRRWVVFAAGLGLLHLALFWSYQGFHPHYAATLVPPLAFLVTGGLRGAVRRWRPPRQMIGALAVLLLFACAAERLVQDDPYVGFSAERAGPQVRSSMQQRLGATGGSHLVFVGFEHGAPLHDTWIANPAVIDEAQVIWAHDLGREANEALMRHAPEREVWHVVVGADADEARLLSGPPPSSSAP